MGQWRWDWLPELGAGHEDFSYEFRAGSHVLSGTVSAVLEGRAIEGTYLVEADAAWRTRRVVVDLASPGGRLELRANGSGRWSDKDGVWIPALDGCLDIDISLTPATNTLPIRRLDLAIGQAEEIEVAYVLAPELRLRTGRQVYERLDERRWRFQAPDSGFTAELTVDAEGFVIDYPGLFTRAK
jgi:hypothetical protein